MSFCEYNNVVYEYIENLSSFDFSRVKKISKIYSRFVKTNIIVAINKKNEEISKELYMCKKIVKRSGALNLRCKSRARGVIKG